MYVYIGDKVYVTNKNHIQQGKGGRTDLPLEKDKLRNRFKPYQT